MRTVPFRFSNDCAADSANSGSRGSRWLLGLVALGTLLALGCRGGRPAGTVDYQQQRAVVHDPYPDPDLGPPVLGTRPRNYQKPLPEPLKAPRFPLTGWLQQQRR